VWKSLYVEKKSIDTVGIAFCCQNSTTKILANLSEFLLAKEKKQINFQTNVDATQCNSCWNNERVGAGSRRLATINWFENNYPTSDTQNELISLDWNSDNVCNLSCISCGPKFSSRWRQEILNYSFKSPSDKKYINNLQDNKFWKLLDFSKLKRLYFNGGEPLLGQDHIEILSHLNDINQLSEIELSYNTNGTVIPNCKIIDYWKKVKLLRICVSIDAIDLSFEYIRWPAKWQQILTFVNFLQQQSFNIIIDITCTIGIHNILEVDRLIEWQHNNLATNAQGDPVNINFQMIGGFSHGGSMLGLTNSSQALAKIILPQLTKIKNYSIWPAIEHSLLTTVGNNQWIAYLDELDSHRKIKWQDYLAQLAESLRISHISGR
jgi:uncharacterized Fe-S cluster-containing radical SAM superfamily protein